jgi:hypothetical protein
LEKSEKSTPKSSEKLGLIGSLSEGKSPHPKKGKGKSREMEKEKERERERQEKELERFVHRMSEIPYVLDHFLFQVK